MARQPLAAAKCSGVDPVVPTVCLCHRESMHKREDGGGKSETSRSESVHPYMYVLLLSPVVVCAFFPASNFLPHLHPQKDRTRGDEERIGWDQRMYGVRPYPLPQTIRRTDCRHIRSNQSNDNTLTPPSRCCTCVAGVGR